MPLFSFYCMPANPSRSRLAKLITSLQIQSVENWQLFFIIKESERKTLAWLLNTFQDPRIKYVEIKNTAEKRVEYFMAQDPNNDLWAGCLSQDSRLEPGTLEELVDSITENPDALVHFTDERSVNRWGLSSRRTRKGEYNHYRGLFQNYLGGLTVISRDILNEIPIAAQANNSPSHYFYQRIRRNFGADAFKYVPFMGLVTHRDHSENRGPKLPSYDFWAVRQHSPREAILYQEGGIVRASLKTTQTFTATIFYEAIGEPVENVNMVHHLLTSNAYANCKVIILLAGSDISQAARFTRYFKDFNPDVRLDLGNRPRLLNQLIQENESSFVALISGNIPKMGWLNEMAAYAFNGCSVVGGKVVYQNRLVQPGIHGWKYDSWAWDTQGKEGQLAVPHNTACVSPAFVLFNRQYFLNQDGFNENLPTYYFQDFCLRGDTPRRDVILLPNRYIFQDTAFLPNPTEVENLRAIWDDFSIPYTDHSLDW